ncbi:hypothetical protein DBR11_22735, partial [Pedobacter sp. HMWF019]
MKKILMICVLLISSLAGFTQITTEQNGWKTSVLGPFNASDLQARRYEIATLGYNSYHWQTGGLIIIELFSNYFTTGYERYVVENGYEQGANSGRPVVKLVESHGLSHSAKITLGTSYDLSTSFAGMVNKALPIYLDIRYRAGYMVKITHLQNRADQLTDINQIKVNNTVSGLDIPDFLVSTILDNNLSSSKNLMVTGDGNHYISNGSLAIGTADPKGYKLAVAGNMIAESIKVQLQTAWPDYVFKDDYKLISLQETEKHIKEKGHLPGIPSAVEVKSEGIDLGEMNGRLLKKIEEMTLH